MKYFKVIEYNNKIVLCQQSHNNHSNSMTTNQNIYLVKTFCNFLNEIHGTNSSTDKTNVVRKFLRKDGKDRLLENKGTFKQLLKKIFNPMETFGLTANALKKFKKSNNYDSDELKVAEYDGLLDLITKLETRAVTGHQALATVWDFINNTIAEYSDSDDSDSDSDDSDSDDSDIEKTLLLLFDKNLKANMSVSTVNKACPGLIPVFKVALANSLIDKTEKHLLTGEWLISQKMDGVRVIALCRKAGSIRFYSRQGKEFETLETIRNALLNTALATKSGWVLDGEMCVIETDDDGKERENFKKAVSAIKAAKTKNPKKYKDINFHYRIFDFLKLNEFEEATSSGSCRKLSKRLFSLKQTLAEKPHDTRMPMFSILQQIPYNEETFASMNVKATDNGWEGLMLRKNCSYRGKRSNDILKVKKFYTEEYKVISVTKAPMKMLNHENGKMEEEKTLKAVQIKHKGSIVHVGSGFSQEERRRYYKDATLIVGKIISVQYFEETKNKSGKVSLRFPTIKCIYGDERDI